MKSRVKTRQVLEIWPQQWGTEPGSGRLAFPACHTRCGVYSTTIKPSNANDSVAFQSFTISWILIRGNKTNS